MRNIIKGKLLSFLLAAALIGSMCTAITAEAKEADAPGAEQTAGSVNLTTLSAESGKCGDNLTWSYDATSKTLTISGTGAMEDYNYSTAGPWRGLDIQNVDIEKGVTEIGSSAFQDCTIKSINIPEGLTRIGSYAFENCRLLTTVELPASLSRLGEDTFGQCKALTSITVKTGNSAYSSIDGVLFNQNRTTLVKYPIGKSGSRYVVPGTVSKIESAAFRFCDNLSEVVLNDNIEGIGANAFWDCHIKDVYLGRKLRSVGDYAFGCTLLTKVTLYSRIAWGKGVFNRCHSLTKAVVEEGITAIPDGTFDSCTGLADVSLPSSLRTIGQSAFEFTGFKEIVLPSGLTTIGSRAFFQLENLTSIVVPASVTNIAEDAFNLSSKLTIKCYPNTVAHKYAASHNIPYAFISDAGNSSDQASVKVSKINLSGISHQIAAGKKVKLTAKVLPANASNKTLIWKSSNSKVAKVNKSGVVTMANRSGGKTVTITAAAADGSGVKKTYKIKSMKGVVKKIAVSGQKTVRAGKTLKFRAKVTATKNANKKLKWTSSNTKFAKVSSSGKVTALKAGKGKKVRITAAATDGSGKKRTVTIRIR